MRTVVSASALHLGAIALAGLSASLVLAGEVNSLNGWHAKPLHVHLTFDDGPHPVYTPQLLDILKANGIKATFFMIGQNVRKNPDIVRRVEREGHTIGNHTDTHPHLPNLDRAGIQQEVDNCEASLEQVLGHRVSYFRPPYGATDQTVREVLFDRQFTRSVTWNVDSEDWKSLDHNVIIPKVLADVQAVGHGIVLMHDIHPETIVSVQPVIDGLRAKGYTFVPTLERLDDPSLVEAGSPALVAGDSGVVAITSQLLATPSPEGAVLAPITAGATVKVVSVIEPWLQVQTADGTQGFLMAHDVTEAPVLHGDTVLKKGAFGPRVESLQKALNAKGASLTVDGDFGPGTDAALRAYQASAGLTPDGIAGPKTLGSLNLPLSP